ncbi:FMN-binding protein [Lactobacillus delbrueckii]|uniref:FMN-binding protein n=1 Tax=Lactobacillus delbrueckii TaxID=1584 RepID=UPI0038545782
MIAAQSTDVDAVSGATVSSNAIMTAVKKALQEASGESQNKTSEELTTDLAIVAAVPLNKASRSWFLKRKRSPGGPPTWVWGHWGSIVRFKRPTSMKSQWLKP